MALSLDPAAIALVLGATALYVRAVRVLARRGRRVPALQQAAWHTGVALTALALLGPFDPLGEELMSAHMAQHLLVADLAAPLLVLGIRTPVLYFMLPRPALVALARSPARAAFRVLRRPLVAIGVYVVVLYGWHVAPAFEAALANDVVHALQHESFVLASVLVWWSALEPKRARLRGELWKAGHIVGARFAGMFLGMAFVALREPVYEDAYGASAVEYGLTPLQDQQLAGGMMLGLDAVIMVAALAFFFWRSAADHDLADARAREAREPAVR